MVKSNLHETGVLDAGHETPLLPLLSRYADNLVVRSMKRETSGLSTKRCIVAVYSGYTVEGGVPACVEVYCTVSFSPWSNAYRTEVYRKFSLIVACASSVNGGCPWLGWGMFSWHVCAG